MSIRSAARRMGPLAWRDRLIDDQREALEAQRAKLDELRGKVSAQRAQLGEQREKLQEQQAALGAERRQLKEQRAVLAAVKRDLRRQKDQLHEVRRDSCVPSFAVKRQEAQRAYDLAKLHGVTPPIWKVNDKEQGYRFARSHGVAVPRQIARYDDPGEIAWAGLPDAFVVKALDGTNGAGVFPLVRAGDAFTDVVCGTQRSADDLVGLLHRRAELKQVGSAVLVEELLGSPYGDGRPVALDCKLYCFYGTVGMIMVRDGASRRDVTGVRARYLAPDGTALGDVMSHVTVDETLPAPLHLSRLVEAAGRMSAALRVPFVRLDFYEREDGIVFGEVTPNPGGSQYPRADIDLELGLLWEDAEARLLAETVRAGGRTVEFGDE